jgi:hypothetical protein
MNEIETLVRLKYQIATGEGDWDSLRDSYPDVVRQEVVHRWERAQKSEGALYLSRNKQWELYLGFLFEKLCAYESKLDE